MEAYFNMVDFNNYYNNEDKFESEMVEMIRSYVEDKKRDWFYEDLKIDEIKIREWYEGWYDHMIIDVKVSNGKTGRRLDGADTFEYEFTFDEGKIRTATEIRRWGTYPNDFSYKTTLFE